MESLPDEIAKFTRAEMDRLNVPGVAVGVSLDGTHYGGGFGVTNVDHPLEVTTDTQFQIGSTSKTYTATVVMMLAEEGVLDLDAPVRTYLPQFTTRSPEASAAVTIRHLLTHRTGWPGDYFKDFGRGEGALARYVANMASAPQQLPPGATFSYCNSGFYLLARVVEVLAGVPFEQVVDERLIAPLGMLLTTYFPEETLGNRVAAGHIVTADGPKVARPWHMARCLNGGGGIIASVRDQLRYAQFHLDGDAGVLADSSRLKMQQPHADAGSMCDAYGLGWMLVDHDGVRLVKHGGATNGFLSSFELFPDRRFACTVLTNADTGRELRDSVAACARRELLGLPDRTWPSYPTTDAALGEYVGEYRAALTTSIVTIRDGVLELTPLPNARTDRRLEPLALPPAPLSFYAADRTVVRAGSHAGERCEFLRGAGGAVEWLRWDGRVARRR